MQIRKNTKAFKAILAIITACKVKPNRKNLVRLYITRAGHSIQDRISTEALQGDSDVFYELNYDAVANNLQSPDRQLHQSDSIPGIYFFQTSTNKSWDETPFEFDESVRKEFSSQGELPVLRKREVVKPYILPVANTESKKTGKQKSVSRAAPVKTRKPAQPSYGLKHKIEFTDLNEVVFAEGQVSKKDVLDYYDKIADYMLPYLKDRPLAIRPAFAYDEFRTIDALAGYVDVPDWVQKNARSGGSLLICNDKEHLLWYVEIGCVEFCCGHSRIMSPDSADYSVITLSSDKTDFRDMIDAAIASGIVLHGLRFPSFIKTDGHAGLHIYLPLEANSTFDLSKQFASDLGKLIQLKKPGLISVQEPGVESNGKISLNYRLNESGKYVVVPYSLVSGKVPLVAAPVTWESIDENFNPEDYDHKSVYKNLQHHGDPMKKLFKKKIDPGAALTSLETNYSFLL